MRKLLRFPNKKWVIALALPVMAAIGSTRAEAAPITFSNTAGQDGGSVTVGQFVVIGDNSGGGTGADGRISAVALGGGGNSSPITGACGTFGCLELGTGAFVGPDASTPGVNDYLYSGTGSYIRIYGDATNDAGNVNRLLYTGTFDNTLNIRLIFDTNCPGPCSGSVTGTVDGGTLNAFLAAYLGIPAATDQGNATTLFFDFVGNSSPQTGWPTGGATANTNSIQTFPTPDGGSTAALLGSVLVAFGMVRRRLGKG